MYDMCACVCALQTCVSAHTGIRGQSQVLLYTDSWITDVHYSPSFARDLSSVPHACTADALLPNHLPQASVHQF